MKKEILLILISSCWAILACRSQRAFWGTVTNGGQNGQGYMYRTDSTGDNLVPVHHFTNTEGARPGRLLLAGNGKLYGLTERGGQGALIPGHKGGVLFEYDMSIDSFRVLFHFRENYAAFPYEGPDAASGLSEVFPGILYGQLISGGLQIGRIFSYNINTEALTEAFSIPTFQGGAGNTTLGNRLAGPLYKASDGFLYSATQANSQCPVGQPNRGSIVRVDPTNNNYSVIYLNPCSGADGYQYLSSFCEYNNSLYSVSLLGGTADKGVIYAYTPSTGVYTKKYDFSGGAGGQNPSPMLHAANNKFYGILQGGPAQPNLPGGGGILFEYDPAVNLYTKKIDFMLGNGAYTNVGIYPTDLARGSNGNLYGTAQNGVYEYNIQQNTTRAAGRFPINMGWLPPERPTLLEVCRKPGYVYQNADYILCPGSPLSHNLQESGAQSLSWKHNGVAEPSQTSGILAFTSVSAADTGTWTAELVNSCGVTETQEIRIHIDIPVIHVQQNGMQLHAQGSAGSLQWIDCNTDMPLSGETGTVFEPSVNGNYAVSVTTANGCSDTSACFLVGFIGLEEAEARHISLYPNPAADFIYLEAENVERLELFDFSGKLCGVNAQQNQDRWTLSAGGLARGVYYLKIYRTDGVSETKKVILH